MADPLERRPPRDVAAVAAGIDLRRAVRHALEAAGPELRILAEGFLAEGSPIDLLGVGAEGELIAVRIAPPGADPETLTRVLADLSWLRARRLEFLKLAAGLGIDPSSEPRGILVASGFARETRAAVDNFPAETIELWRLRAPRDPAREPGPVVLEREPIEKGAERPAPRPASPGWSPRPLPGGPRRTTDLAAPALRRPERPAGDTAPAPAPAEPPTPLTAPPSPSAFRTGLQESDLA